MNTEPRKCPSCGLVMSKREAEEQGACNECRPDQQFDQPERDYDGAFDGNTVYSDADPGL